MPPPKEWDESTCYSILGLEHTSHIVERAPGKGLPVYTWELKGGWRWEFRPETPTHVSSLRIEQEEGPRFHWSFFQECADSERFRSLLVMMSEVYWGTMPPQAVADWIEENEDGLREDDKGEFLDLFFRCKQATNWEVETVSTREEGS